MHKRIMEYINKKLNIKKHANKQKKYMKIEMKTIWIKG